VRGSLGTIIEADAIFDDELALLIGVRDSGDVMAILQAFPSKQIAGVVAKSLGMSIEGLFQLMSKALRSNGPTDELVTLGDDLSEIIGSLDLPARAIGERPFDPPA
jgi:hypothetical protein